MRETIDTTYADLRPSDLVIDKSGQAWPVNIIGGALDEDYPEVTFWLKDPATRVNAHLVVKAKANAVKVSRLPTQADEAAKLEAEFPKPPTIDFDFRSTATLLPDSYATTEQAAAEVESILAEAGVEAQDMVDAVMGVEKILGGTVEAEVTAAEVDAAAAATDDAPLTIIPFADMTPLEQRSHLYLLHGVYGHDLVSKAELIALHDQAHAATAAGTLNSRHVPHTHE